MSSERKTFQLQSYNDANMQCELAAVAEAIHQITSEGLSVSFYNVSERSRVSRSTLYRNNRLRVLVEEARRETRKSQAVPNAFASLQEQIASLQGEVEVINNRLRALETRLP